ncbi:MAG: peptidyl-tRNA hydrolase Pth2 [Methanomassiliicoccaceae archaeon]|jgi:PTH2 family peptidyl-tRNA hydrolase|nr:peptidyl-tRNA hydrolase Pth2 [Methanomassiliicoccaceae archaeon]
MADEYKMVIVVRSDLGMSKGKTAAQVAHAAVNCALAAKKKDPEALEKWMNNAYPKIVLKTDNEMEIFEIKAMADAQGMINSVVTDAGRTEIAPGSVTCIGLGPGAAAKIDRITGDLSML